MKIELDRAGNVLNTFDDTAEAGEWYPDETVIRQETESGSRRGSGPLRISREQSEGWPRRAARRWNVKTMRWESTGGETEQSALEKARKEIQQPLPADATLEQVIARLNSTNVVTVEQEKSRVADKVTISGSDDGERANTVSVRNR